jgi:pyruvate,water dikinase
MHYTLGFEEIDRTQVAQAGGKGANLGELSRIEGIRVPAGFVVTTDAFRRTLGDAPSRRAVETAVIPDDVAADIGRALAQLGDGIPCAVRSSATVEDSPAASFAGQHDSFLNIVGPAAVLEHVRRCWGSLFTERAVAYRTRNDVDSRKVRMAVVVQRMVPAESAGVLFTADPVTGNRKVTSVEAVTGLGEALVSGHVNADVFKLRDGGIVEKQERQGRQTLSDAQLVRLEQIGRRIEAHFGRPQDIEWCLADGDFHFVQTRPITTLYPIPVRSDTENHVYLSVGHQQMMTDAHKPLGISIRELTGAAVFHEAGGRQFVDVTRGLSSPTGRAALLGMFGAGDPLTREALETLIERGDFIPPLSDAGPPPPAPGGGPPAPIETDPAIPKGLIAQSEASVEALKRGIRGKTGSELLDLIRDDFQELKRILTNRQGHAVFTSAMDASTWLNDHVQEWLGEKSAADTLTLSVPNNVTSEMGLALLDVADVVRESPEVVAYLEKTGDEQFLDVLPSITGGREARAAIVEWLDKYGMRGVGEIDITRPRWSERPILLIPLILGNVRNFAPGEAKRRFDHGLELARNKEAELLTRLRGLPGGEAKAAETKRMIDRVRTFIGYREYPKYGMISRYFVYKQALMEEAGRLTKAGVIREKEDIFYLTFPELEEAVRSKRVDEDLIRRRKELFKSYRALTPPRVLTSEGEALSGKYRRGDLPAGALAGLPVSAGTVAGRARVIVDVSTADLEPGDIHVTANTEPGWTAAFTGITGLVTEVGGLMTHGAVIAREYGLPAVVGVENATRLIRDGQRIRVNGTDGYVELLG